MGETESTMRSSSEPAGDKTDIGIENKAVDTGVESEQSVVLPDIIITNEGEAESSIIHSSSEIPVDKIATEKEKAAGVETKQRVVSPDVKQQPLLVMPKDKRVTKLIQEDSWTAKSSDKELEKNLKSRATDSATRELPLARQLANVKRFLSVSFLNKDSDYVLVNFPKHPQERTADLGFTLHGGVENPCFPGDPGIFIKYVIPGSVVDKKLRPGDRVLSINGLNVSKVPVRYAREAARKAKGNLRLYIKKAPRRQQRINDCIRKENDQETPVFNNEQIEEIEDAFSVYDGNGSGKIKMADVFPLIRSLGHNPLEAAVWVYMNELGLTANKKLKFEEFLRLMATLTVDEDHEEQTALDSIRAFDTEESGFISTAELREALQCMPGSSQMTDFELKEILRKADPDGDGKIKIKDFQSLLEPSVRLS